MKAQNTRSSSSKKVPFLIILLAIVLFGSVFMSFHTHSNIVYDISSTRKGSKYGVNSSDGGSGGEETLNVNSLQAAVKESNNDHEGSGGGKEGGEASNINNISTTIRDNEGMKESELDVPQKQQQEEEKKEEASSSTTIEIEPISTSSSTTTSSTKETEINNNSNTTSPFAYVFLVAGCDPSQPKYLGYIYNIIVSKAILDHYKSTNDVVIMVRMHADTEHTKLPIEHERILQKCNVKIHYLPKPDHGVDNFHTAMMDKFRILMLVQYKRVLFLDSDVIPLNNLDYMFDLSYNPLPSQQEGGEKSNDKNENNHQFQTALEENVILAYKGEPANGGFFLLTPSLTDYHTIYNLIEEKEHESGYHFNETIGWGHIFTKEDPWLSFKHGKNGTLWDWHGAFTDQGLLYYWTKYYQKSVSIVVKDKIQRWKKNDDDSSKVSLVETMPSRSVFGRPKKFVLGPSNHYKDNKPYCDFEHFIGLFKPWIDPNRVGAPPDVPSFEEASDTRVLWFHVLRKLNKEHDLNIKDIEQMRLGQPTLGIYPKRIHVKNISDAKKMTKKDDGEQEQKEDEEKIIVTEEENKDQAEEKSGQGEEVAVSTTTTTADVIEMNNNNNSSNSSNNTTTTSIAAPIEEAKVIFNNNTVDTTTNERFAYAFLIAGCNPSDPTYRGYIYSVAVSKELLKRFGSTAEVVVMIRMHVETNHTQLPPEDEMILTKSGIIVKYLPKPLVDNFHTAMMDKFRILELTEYSRILYLDSDVIPLNNLDYFFHLSTGPNAVLEENVGLAYNLEPTNGGFFMMKPGEGDYDQIAKIIEKREREGYHFNETIGWGHEMVHPDGWESLKGYEGTKWNFYGSFTDQGLIYYWTKYVKKKVTLVNKDRVKTWKANDDGKVELVRDESGAQIFGHIEKKSDVRSIHRGPYKVREFIPYRDFHHFREFFKPWVANKKHKVDHGPHELWFDVLREINERYNFGIDMDNIGFKKPSLGLFPTFNEVEKMKAMHEKNDLQLA